MNLLRDLALDLRRERIITVTVGEAFFDFPILNPFNFVSQDSVLRIIMSFCPADGLAAAIPEDGMRSAFGWVGPQAVHLAVRTSKIQSLRC